MTEHKSMLCIGGPLAGQRFAARSGSGFRVPVKMEISANDPNSEDFQPNKPVRVDDTYYRAETFHTQQGGVSFWIPAGLTHLEAMTLLLESYEAKQPDSRLRRAVDYVLSKFKQDERAGYRSRDRQFAIAILDKAIDPDAPAWMPTPKDTA